MILRDITRRKRFEDALKASQRELRELSARVLEAREEEGAHRARAARRARPADRAQDGPGVAARAPARRSRLAARAAEMGALLDRTVGSTRRISADLRPLMLDDLGLPRRRRVAGRGFRQALRRRLPRQRVGGRAGRVQGGGNRGVPRGAGSLTNIARHSGAKNAWVVLGAVDGVVHVEIEDDGRGIAPEDLARPARSG